LTASVFFVAQGAGTVAATRQENEWTGLEESQHDPTRNRQPN
jgi:hypothetical protein